MARKPSSRDAAPSSPARPASKRTRKARPAKSKSKRAVKKKRSAHGSALPKPSKRSSKAAKPQAGRRPREQAAIGMGVSLTLVTASTGKPRLSCASLPAGIDVAKTGVSTKPVTDEERYRMGRRLRRSLREDRLASLLAAVAHPQRLVILGELLPGPCTHQQLTKATGLKAGPLYFHIRELRGAGLIGPKVRDLYQLTTKGEQALLGAMALGKIAAG